EPVTGGLFRHRFVVPQSAADGNGHVNNVVYIQWMQDAAIRHADSCGGTEAARAAGGAWLARSHKVEYLSPAYPGDTLEAATWVAWFHRTRSLRQYRFTRVSDGRLLVRGETEWVFVNAAGGRPVAVPASVQACFPSTPHQKVSRENQP
ncbi:MAG: acyl-CoA thioesterase, partial [Kiritimatiellia bacterium]